MVMQMEEGLDTGPIAMAEKLTITPDATAGELHDRLAFLALICSGGRWRRWSAALRIFSRKAAEGVAYADKIDKAEARVDFSNRRRKFTISFVASRLFLAPFETDFGKGPERVKILRSTPGRRARGARRGARRDAAIACGVAPCAWSMCSARARPLSALGIHARRCGSARDSAVLMPRYKLLIEYDGADYVGWQRQANGRPCRRSIEGAGESFYAGGLRCAEPDAPIPGSRHRTGGDAQCSPGTGARMCS